MDFGILITRAPKETTVSLKNIQVGEVMEHGVYTKTGGRQGLMKGIVIKQQEERTIRLPKYGLIIAGFLNIKSQIFVRQTE